MASRVETRYNCANNQILDQQTCNSSLQSDCNWTNDDDCFYPGMVTTGTDEYFDLLPPPNPPSNPYTTQELIDNLRGYMNDAQFDPQAQCGITSEGAMAMLDVDSQEITANAQKAIYSIRHPVSQAGGCYRITWSEVFYQTGGTTTAINRTYQWNGVIPSGYNPSNMNTWPKTPDYTVNVPPTEGYIRVENIQHFCTGCV
jgi:hypothetical protein